MRRWHTSSVFVCDGLLGRTFGVSSNCGVLYCIVLHFRLFPDIGDKTHPFTIYDTFMQKVRVETQRYQITLKGCN